MRRCWDFAGELVLCQFEVALFISAVLSAAPELAKVFIFHIFEIFRFFRFFRIFFVIFFVIFFSRPHFSNQKKCNCELEEIQENTTEKTRSKNIFFRSTLSGIFKQYILFTAAVTIVVVAIHLSGAYQPTPRPN